MLKKQVLAMLLHNCYNDGLFVSRGLKLSNNRVTCLQAPNIIYKFVSRKMKKNFITIDLWYYNY